MTPPTTPRARFSLRVSLLTTAVMMVVLTSLAVHLPWSWTSQRNTEDLAGQINAQIIGALQTEVNAMLRAAQQDQIHIADLVADGTIDLRRIAAVESLLLSYVKGNPYYSFVGIGLPSGDYLGAQRKDSTQLVSIVSRWNAESKSALRTERIFTTDGKEHRYFKTVQKPSDYYAPERVWYSMAAERPASSIITDTYVFSNTGRPGVNTAAPIYQDGKLLGVVTVAIELDRLSDFMRSQLVGRSGTAFMVDSQGTVLASRESLEFVSAGQTQPGDIKLPRLSAVQTPSLALANRALTQRGIRDFSGVSQTMTFRHTESDAAYFVAVKPVEHNRWNLVTWVPATDFEARTDQNTRTVLLIVLGVTAGAAALALYLGQTAFVRPLSDIIEQTGHVANFSLTQVHAVESRIREVHALSTAVVQMGAGLGSFGKYLPAGLVKNLLAKGVIAQPYAEKRTMSVFFMDLAGFTTISEALGPGIVPHLDRYFGAMSQRIEARKGTIDKFIGDCVMAFWGAPDYDEDHALNACRAALDCLETLEWLRTQWPAEWADQLDVRIGVNTGRMIVGNIGSDTRINYTVVGDPVNLASRLESGCKGYGIRCLIGQGTYELAKYDIVARRIDVSQVKGKTEPVVMYELLDLRERIVDPSQYAWIAVYEDALAALLAGDRTRARAGFLKTIEMRGEDPPSRVMLTHCA